MYSEKDDILRCLYFDIEEYKRKQAESRINFIGVLGLSLVIIVMSLILGGLLASIIKNGGY